MTTYEWTITEDWENPAKGEKWSAAGGYEAACSAVLRKAMATNRVCGFIQINDDPPVILIDFGSHSRWGLVRKGSEGKA